VSTESGGGDICPPTLSGQNTCFAPKSLPSVVTTSRNPVSFPQRPVLDYGSERGGGGYYPDMAPFAGGEGDLLPFGRIPVFGGGPMFGPGHFMGPAQGPPSHQRRPPRPGRDEGTPSPVISWTPAEPISPLGRLVQSAACLIAGGWTPISPPARP